MKNTSNDKTGANNSHSYLIVPGKKNSTHLNVRPSLCQKTCATLKRDSKLEVYFENCPNVYLAVHFHSSTNSRKLRFYKVESHAFSFHMHVKPAVERKQFILKEIDVDSQSVIFNT